MLAKLFVCASVAVMCMFLMTPSSFCQDLDTVTVSGKVTDAAGLPIAGATVTATLTDTGQKRTVTTNEDGLYKLITLKPGQYKVSVASKGFGAEETPVFPTVSAQTVVRDFKLNPASVTAETTVTVTDDDQPLIDPTRTVVGGTVTQREIEELPNTTRNALDLVLTLGGTSEEQLSTSGLAEDRNASTTPLEQGNFSLSGGVAYSNNVTIDGMDNNDDYTSRDRFQPSIESIAEVQVITNQFSAEYGRASGGRINLRTKAGGNKIRGRAFMFFRDESLNANTWYNNSRGISRPPLQEIDPGFFLSGPVRLPFSKGKNHTFFAVSYERDKLADTTLIAAYVPVGTNPHFTLPGSTGGGQACDNASATACTTTPPTAGLIAPYQKEFATPNVSNVVTARVDHRLFKNNDLTLGFQWAAKDNKRTAGTAPLTRIENALQEKNNNTKALNVTDNQVYGAYTVNQTRLQYSQYTPSFQTQDPFAPVVIIGYRDPITNSTRSLVAGNSTAAQTSSSGGTIFFPENRKERRWQVQDTLTRIAGRHMIKLGVDIQNVNSHDLGLGDTTGTYNFGSVLNYTQNVVTRFRLNFGTAQDVINRYNGIFGNDQMRLGNGLTLSLGLRYERETAVHDTNNFGPRVGLAWSPSKATKTVIRFGAGIFYNRVLLRTVGDSIQNTLGNQVSFDSNTIGTSGTDNRRTAILNAISSTFPSSYATVADLKAAVTAGCAAVIGVPLAACTSNSGFTVGNLSSAGNPLRSVEPNLRIPESYQFNVGFERQLVKGWVLEANYTYNKTVHLWRDTNGNAPVLPAGYADWTAYLLANPFVLSPTRKYTFYLGSASDGSGIATTQAGPTTCTTTTANCFVNLNSINSSSTEPAVAASGINGNSTGAPVGIALAAIAKFRRDQTVEETSVIGSRGNALYNGLVVELRSRFHRFGNGFGSTFRLNYTLSKTMDDGLNNTANAEINGNFSREWARSLQDRRHRIAFSGTFDTPSWFGHLRFSPVFRYGSSAPFNLGAGGSDRNLDDLGTDRLNFNGNVKDIVYRNPGSPVPDALIAQFSVPAIGAIGSNLPRNAGRGPSFYTFDLSMTREWKIKDRYRLRPVIEADNILNAAVFSYGSEFVDFQALRGDGTAPTQTQLTARQNFLVPTRTYRQRQIRLGIRFDF